MKQVIYNTKQKSAIINQIKLLKDKHFTVDSICEMLSKKGETVGRTTVYRCLENLSKEGILRKFVMPQGESVCYQYISEAGCNEHFHLKCEKCGALIHLECDEFGAIAEHIKNHHGFCLNPLKTVIYGVCEECITK